MTDLDEYIDVMKQPESNKTKIASILDSYEKYDHIGALKLKNWDFGSGPKGSREPGKLLIENIWKSPSPSKNRHKCIVRPWNVWYFRTHGISQGKLHHVLNVETEIYFAHFSRHWFNYNVDFEEMIKDSHLKDEYSHNVIDNIGGYNDSLFSIDGHFSIEQKTHYLWSH